MEIFLTQSILCMGPSSLCVLCLQNGEHFFIFWPSNVDVCLCMSMFFRALVYLVLFYLTTWGILFLLPFFFVFRDYWLVSALLLKMDFGCGCKNNKPLNQAPVTTPNTPQWCNFVMESLEEDSQNLRRAKQRFMAIFCQISPQSCDI